MSGNRGRRKQDDGEAESLTKEEDAIARFLRFNCPTKVGNCNGNDFAYFVGSKAVDVLLESKKYGAAASVPKFKTKGDCEFFIRTLIDKGAIFRAKKVVLKKKTPEEKRKSKKDGKISATSSPKTKREKELLKEEEEKRDESDSGTDVKKDKDDESDEKKEKKKKVILVMQQNQSFSSDTSDVYAWVFDPTPLLKKIIGALMLVGVILGCLFPLWPDWLRLGVYYLSMSGIVFLVSIMGLAIARTVLFGIIYGLTFGKHHLWVLPNLTSDCGFFESFKPFYTYEYVSGDEKKNDKKKSKNNTKDEESESAKESKASAKLEKTPETSKNASSNEEEPEIEEENEVEEEEEHESEASSEALPKQPFETVPAEEFIPESTNKRRRKARREDDSDFVMVDK